MGLDPVSPRTSPPAFLTCRQTSGGYRKRNIPQGQEVNHENGARIRYAGEAIFTESWASEAEIATCSDKRSCYIATKEDDIIGFSCYDSVRLGFFGPMGVHEDNRERGTGRALLLAALQDMMSMGYGYAIIGWTHLFDFYRKAVDAVEIPDSFPGVYRGYLG